MALLNISVLTASAAASGVKVVAELSDARGVPVPGFTAAGAVFVAPAVETTDASGDVILDLVPNDEITPLGTYYTVRIGPASFLITKTDVTQNLSEAIAVLP